MNWLSEAVLHSSRTQSQVEVFGTILYTEADANIIKVLNDNDYWKSLDLLSRQRWCIFSIRGKQGQSEPTLPIPGRIGYFAPIYKEPEENLKLLDDFEIESSAEFPLFLIFMIDENSRIKKIEIKIDDDSIDRTYNSIRKIIKMVTDVIEEGDPRYYKNTNEIFTLIQNEYSRGQEIKYLKKSIEIIKSLKTLWPFFFRIVS